jgi:hypothetical protein
LGSPTVSFQCTMQHRYCLCYIVLYTCAPLVSTLFNALIVALPYPVPTADPSKPAYARALLSLQVPQQFTECPYESPVIRGCSAAGISGPAQRFPHAQRARQWLNIPLGPGPGCRDATCPPALGVGSARNARVQQNASFPAKIPEKEHYNHLKLKAHANTNTGFYILWHGFRLYRRSAFTSGDTL